MGLNVLAPFGLGLHFEKQTTFLNLCLAPACVPIPALCGLRFRQSPSKRRECWYLPPSAPLPLRLASVPSLPLLALIGSRRFFQARQIRNIRLPQSSPLFKEHSSVYLSCEASGEQAFGENGIDRKKYAVRNWYMCVFCVPIALIYFDFILKRANPSPIRPLVLRLPSSNRPQGGGASVVSQKAPAPGSGVGAF